MEIKCFEFLINVKKIATRESYGNALVECGADFPDLVVLDADLAGATKTGVFNLSFLDLTVTKKSIYPIALIVQLSGKRHAYRCGNALSKGTG